MRDRESLRLDLSGVGDNWPLVSYVRDDPVYYQKYHLLPGRAFLTDVFILEELADTYQYYHDLIAPYVLDEGQEFTQISSSQAFDESVAGLIQYSRDRIAAAGSFLVDQ